MDRALDLKYKRIWFLAVCMDCNQMRMPFKDGAERQVWANEHGRNVDPLIGRPHNVRNIVEIWED